MEPLKGHRMPMFSDTHHHQADNTQKPLSMTPQTGKKSTVSAFSNGLQRPFAATRSSGLSENAVPRNSADSSLHFSGFKFNMTTPRAESHAPLESSSLQHSSSFYDSKGGTLSMRSFKEEDHDIDGDKQFPLLGNRTSQHFNFPVEYRQTSQNTAKEEIGSRSSIGLLENDMTEEDLFISKMASNNRQTKVEIAKLREQNAELKSQIATKIKHNADLSRQNSDMSQQNSELSRRMTQLKLTTKDTIDKTNKSYIELRDCYETLRIQYQASSMLVNDAQKTMESLEELRDAVRTGLQVFLDDGGHLPQIGETRAVVNELQAELTRTQQVADLLRDKLQNMGSELVDARSRITELEEHFGNDRKLMTSTTSELQRASERVAEVTEYLKLQKHEVIDALSKLAQAEDRLVHNQTRLQERDAMIHSMRQEMESTRQEISDFEEAMNDRKAQHRILQNTISFQEQHMKDLEERLQQVETEARDTKALEKTLIQENARLTSEGECTRERLRVAEARMTEMQNEVITLSAQSARVVLERDTLLDKLKATDAQLAEAKREEESSRERFAETRTSLKVLQERFDDQTCTLRLTKESVGEAQDRLQFANNAILTLTESVAESNHRASVIEERERSLQLRLDETNVAIGIERDVVNSLRKELLERQKELSRYEGAQQATDQISEKCARETDQRIQELESKADCVRGELIEKQRFISELTQRLAIAETPSDEHEQELLVLRTRVHELEQSETRLLERATSITSRHERGDLNDNEWMLVKSLAQKARDVFEGELVEKNNSIRMKDNLIKQHEARISQLETSLARRIREIPPVGSSREQDETFWNEPPSGHGNQKQNQQNPSGVHETASKEPRVNDGSYIGEFEDAHHPTRGHHNHNHNVKRTISVDDDDDQASTTRPTRRPKNSKHPDMEKINDKVPGTYKKKAAAAAVKRQIR